MEESGRRTPFSSFWVIFDWMKSTTSWLLITFLQSRDVRKAGKGSTHALVSNRPSSSPALEKGQSSDAPAAQRPPYHSPDSITGNDHEVVVIVYCQHFDVRQGRDHLLFWREVLVPLVEVIPCGGEEDV